MNPLDFKVLYVFWGCAAKFWEMFLKWKMTNESGEWCNKQTDRQSLIKTLCKLWRILDCNKWQILVTTFCNFNTILGRLMTKSNVYMYVLKHVHQTEPTQIFVYYILGMFHQNLRS